MMLMAQTAAEKLRGLREERSLSQRELAAFSGVSPATILKIERGNSSRPHPRTVRKLAEALGVEPRALQAD